MDKGKILKKYKVTLYKRVTDQTIVQDMETDMSPVEIGLFYKGTYSVRKIEFIGEVKGVCNE